MFVQNEKVVEKYSERVMRGELPIFRGHVLDEEDLTLRRHILNLMTKFATDWSCLSDYVPHLDTIPNKLAEMSRDQLVRLRDGGCEITDAGKTFLRNVCMAFDARLARQDSGAKLFSRTI
jgi:oxygen-independent coproporphyrinogen-3 oxidase